MERVAIPTDESMVSAHFGHCSQFTIFDIEGDKIIKQETLANPGHQPGVLPVFLAEHGVQQVIVAGLGQRAKDLFDNQGIGVISGVRGKISEVITAYLNGELESADTYCSHDDAEHEHHHSHTGHCQH